MPNGRSGAVPAGRRRSGNDARDVSTNWKQQSHDCSIAKASSPAARRFTRYVHVKYSLQPRALPILIARSLDRTDRRSTIVADFERAIREPLWCQRGLPRSRHRDRQMPGRRLGGDRAACSRAEWTRRADGCRRTAIKSRRPVYFTEIARPCDDGGLRRRPARTRHAISPALRWSSAWAIRSSCRALCQRRSRWIWKCRADSRMMPGSPEKARCRTSQSIPITLEVLRHRLWMINDEQGRVAAQLSGSPVVYEAKDFNSSLLTPEGDSLFVGIYMTRLSLCLNHVVKNVIASFKDNIGFADGDAFVTNDPVVGRRAYERLSHGGADLLRRYAGVLDRACDARGRRRRSESRSFTVGTRDVYGEAPLIPPHQDGRTRRHSRRHRGAGDPQFADLALNGLNMRARVAAINRTRQRIQEVIARIRAADPDGGAVAASSIWCRRRSPAGSKSLPDGAGSTKASSITTATRTGSIASAFA